MHKHGLFLRPAVDPGTPNPTANTVSYQVPLCRTAIFDFNLKFKSCVRENLHAHIFWTNVLRYFWRQVSPHIKHLTAHFVCRRRSASEAAASRRCTGPASVAARSAGKRRATACREWLGACHSRLASALQRGLVCIALRDFTNLYIAAKFGFKTTSSTLDIGCVNCKVLLSPFMFVISSKILREKTFEGNFVWGSCIFR